MNIKDITKRKSIEAVKNVLDDFILDDFQCVDAVTAVYRKRCVLGHDTGLGKTIVASAIIKMLHNERRNRKFLFVCKRNQFAQTPAKIRKATGLRVIAISSEESSLDRKLFNGEFLKYDVVLLAEEVLDDAVANALLLTYKHEFCGIFVDEIHTMCNYMEANRAGILKAMMKNFEYRIAMTATPMTSSLEQWCRILAMIEPENFENWRDTLYDLEHYNLNLERDFPGLYIRRTRVDLGIPNVYNNHIHVVPAMPHQYGAKGKNLFRLCKGSSASNQVNKLVEILKGEKDKNPYSKGIVYIRHHDTRKWVTSELDKVGIKYECINGLTPTSERKRIMDEYNSNRCDLVITSTTSSIDLDGDFVVLYEFTCELRQILGRLERGLVPKEIQVHYIFTDDTEEIEYFLEKIYKRSLILQTILKRDYKMIIEIGNRIKKQQEERAKNTERMNL